MNELRAPAHARAIADVLIRVGMLHHGPREGAGPPWESAAPISWGVALYDAGLRVAALPAPADEEERPHPEATCQRCGRPNVRAWHAPSPLWNAVMRGPSGDAYEIVCPPCFAELAEAHGFRYLWHFGPHEDVSSLWRDRDGRTWDADKCLWVAASAPPASPDPGLLSIVLAAWELNATMPDAGDGDPLSDLDDSISALAERLGIAPNAPLDELRAALGPWVEVRRV